MNNVAFIIPTGLGCTIGGHAGDATPASKLIASVCDRLILHPNVVNASDINEMSHNSLYVEGSILDRFLENEINLDEVNSNRILVVVNEIGQPITTNAVNASRINLGANIEIEELNTPLIMEAMIENKMATGVSSGVSELIDQLKDRNDFDAVAIATPIDMAEGLALDYFRKWRDDSYANPWGGIESKVSREIATALNKPVAHAPVESLDVRDDDPELFNILYTEVVDPRKSAEVISSCYIHCVLKGLHKAPNITRFDRGINVSSITCLVSPYGCIGRPHEACFKAGIPVIAVRENKTFMNQVDDRIIYVDNYLEATGVVACIHAGITIESVETYKVKENL
jgi:hypothetical protein